MSIGARVYGLAAVLLGVQGLVFAGFGAMGALSECAGGRVSKPSTRLAAPNAARSRC